MSEAGLSRRAFLQSSGGVLMGTLAASSGALALLAPSRSWALPLDALGDHEGKTLLTFTREIYPHKTLDDAVYALVVKDLDKAAAGDAAVHRMLSGGVRALDAAGDGAWRDRDPGARFVQVQAMDGGDFFEKVRSTAVVSLYNNDMAFAHFGYPGSAGDPGYLYRGFNDLTWLDDPPAEASGPIPGRKTSDSKTS